ncbi:hypothetical protein PAMA_000851 [Pampus argenteus]
MLLFLNHHDSSGAVNRTRRCISSETFDIRVNKLRSRYLSARSPANNTLTCQQAAKEMRGDVSNRSLSPWKYSLKRNDSRSPHEFTVAECLCKGCIINQDENMTYNSVPVFAQQLFLIKSRCPHNPNEYNVEREFITIPVACTCVVPNSVG